MAPPPSIFAPYRYLVWTTIALTVLTVISPQLPAFRNQLPKELYLPLHMAGEFVAIAVSFMVFAFAWHTRNLRVHSNNVKLLAGVFLAVAVVDFAHTLSIGGMPDFITPYWQGKGIYFWLIGRYVAALGLLAVALASGSSSSIRLNWPGVFASVLSFSVLAYWIGLYHFDWLPTLFVPGSGLTPFKKNAEYALVLLYGAAALILMRRFVREPDRDHILFAAAAWILALCEIFFSAYTTITDLYNVVGHVYKFIAYILIYQAVFATSVMEPGRRLAEVEERYRALVENSQEGILLHDDGSIHYANPAAVSILRAGSPDALIGRTVYEFVAEKSQQRVRERREQIYRTGGSLPYIEVQWRCLDGQLIDAEIATASIDTEGRRMLQTQIRDISQRKLAEDALRESESQLSAIFQNSPIGIAVTRVADGTIMEVNSALLHTFGYERDELIGQSSLSLQLFVDPTQRDRGIEQLKERGSINNFPIDYFSKNGNVLAMEISARFLDLGGTQCLVTMMVNVGERRRHEEASQKLNEELEKRIQERTRDLQVANDELESFSYSVSHDLRAPLRAIQGFSSLLEAEYADKLDERGRDYFRRVRGGAVRMAALIDDLLDLSRISRRSMQHGLVDLSALAREAAEELQLTVPGRRVDWRIAADVSAEGDSGLLRIVLQNLIGNAWKYSSKRELASIEFGRIQWNNQPAFFVRDNGDGFDMTYADKLFRAFHRLHSPEEFPGTGIGLATVNRIVRRHGGEVGAEGEIGQGATFYFTL